MKLCVITFKPCWQGPNDAWYSDGGFPIQMAGISSLFDQTAMVVVGVEARSGGIPLPPQARIVPLREPRGQDFSRKLFLVGDLGYYLPALIKEIRAADVVHVPLPGDLPLLGLVTALAMRKRVLARYCGAWDVSSTAMNRVSKGLMRWFAGGRNVMLATGISQTQAAPNVHWNQTSVITRAEITSNIPDLERPLSSPPRLACVGRLSPEKGIDDLLAAMALLAKAPGADSAKLPRLTLIGDGPQRAALEQQAANLGLNSLVTFAGQQNRAELLALLNQHDVLVAPSLTEALGKARLDAMACGLPVITTPVGFGAEILGAAGERGWLVPLNDPARLAQAIGEAIAPGRDWPALRRRCRSFAERYTLEEWIEKIGAICAQQWGMPLSQAQPLRPRLTEY